MTAKQKAKELIDRFFRITPQPYTIDEIKWNGKILKLNEWDKDWTKNFSKQSALICVDEMIKCTHSDKRSNSILDKEYWQQVRTEIINRKI